MSLLEIIMGIVLLLSFVSLRIRSRRTVCRRLLQVQARIHFTVSTRADQRKQYLIRLQELFRLFFSSLCSLSTSYRFSQTSNPKPRDYVMGLFVHNTDTAFPAAEPAVQCRRKEKKWYGDSTDFVNLYSDV